MRTEKDSIGEKEIPDNAYYGIQTLRAIENFPISGLKAHRLLIKAYALIKKACALSNLELGLLPCKKADAIVKAAQEAADGKLNGEFPVDVFQAGSGTSFNMNVNEVIANRALEILGHSKGEYKTVHPNDHVNMAQSTNDTYPTAMRIAILFKLEEFYPALLGLSEAFYKKGAQFDNIVKIARTHLQDAVPIRLGQEFTGYGRTLEKCGKNIKKNAEELYELGIGGTAAGTGINTHPEFAQKVIGHLRGLTSLELSGTQNLVEIMQSQQAINHVSSAVKNLAVELHRISCDLRLLSSGPNTGLAEITLPAVQPGSSIMPGKVNPSILECVNIVCLDVIAADSAVSMAAQNSQLNVNIYMPLMSYKTLSALDIFQNALVIMAEKCIAGIEANREICESYVSKSSSLATALNSVIGYEKATEIAKESIASRKTIKEVVLEKGLLPQEELDKILDPKKLTEPNIP